MSLAAGPAGAVVGAPPLRLVPRQARVPRAGRSCGRDVDPAAGILGPAKAWNRAALLFVSGLCSAYQVTAGATFVRLTPPPVRGRAGFARTGIVAGHGIGGRARRSAGAAGQCVDGERVGEAAGAPVALAAAEVWTRWEPTLSDPGFRACLTATSRGISFVAAVPTVIT